MKCSAAGKSELKLLRAFKSMKEIEEVYQTNSAMLALPGSSKISTASDAKITCIALTIISSPHWLTPSLLPHNLYLLHGHLRQTEQDGGAGEMELNLQQGLNYFSSGPDWGNEVLRRRTEFSKWCLLFVLLLHSCLSLPALKSLPSSPFLCRSHQQ